MSTSFVAFFFEDRSKACDRSKYGQECEAAFLNALETADPEAKTWSSLLSGYMIASALAEKTIAARAEPKSRGDTVGLDMELFRTVIWDLADTIATQWHTLNRQTFPTALGHDAIYCVAIPSLPNDVRTPVDRSLIKARGYLGALEIDRGNPIQVRLMEMLRQDAVIRHGEILLELSPEGQSDTQVSGASSFMNGEIRVPYSTLTRHAPAKLSELALSPRGRMSLERYEGKRRFTVEERVIDALSKLQRSTLTFDFELSENRPLLEATLPPSNFLKNTLDPSRSDGGPTALFFREVLGIYPKDWRYLASQFHQGLKKHSLNELQIKSWEGGFGARVICDIPILGLNGRTAMVKTAWNMLPGAIPSLSTAYPAEEIPLASSIHPHVVKGDLEGPSRWTALHALAEEAGQKAARDCVPTPVRIAGSSEMRMEGVSGISWVCVPDARRGFARWLLRTNRTLYKRGKGAIVQATTGTLSHERSLAFAKAYAAVLELNGVAATVESWLD
jgi:hypothetical protein